MLIHFTGRRRDLPRTREIFEKIDRKLKEKAQEFSDASAVYKIVLKGPEGGTWMVDLREGSTGVREGSEDAQCTITTKDEHFVKLFEGKLSPENALLTGKIKLSGDVILALKFGELLKRNR